MIEHTPLIFSSSRRSIATRLVSSTSQREYTIFNESVDNNRLMPRPEIIMTQRASIQDTPDLIFQKGDDNISNQQQIIINTKALEPDNFLRYNKEEFTDYLKFLQADDYYDKNFMKRMKKTAEQNNQTQTLNELIKMLKQKAQQNDELKRFGLSKTQNKNIQ